MERTRYSRRVKSPSFFALEQEPREPRQRQPRSPSRGRSPGRPRAATQRSRSRTPSRSRNSAASSRSAAAVSSNDTSNVAAVSPANSTANFTSPSTTTPAANGAQKWKPNFDRFKPSFNIDKKAVLDVFLDLLKVNVSVALVAAVFITTVFSYLLCNKNRCKLPSKIPGLAKIIQDISPLSAYIYLGFFALQFLFAFIPKRSNIISALVSVFAVGALYIYPIYPITSLLDQPVEFLNLSLITSLVLAGLQFLKGYRKSRSSTGDKVVYGYLYGFRNNNELFGKNLEVVFHQIGFIQLAITDILFAITLYELKFPVLYSTVLALHFLFVLEKVLFPTNKDYVPFDIGFFANFFYLVYPGVSSLSVYIAYKTALKEHTYYEFAGAAAAFWIFGFYTYCKAKYDPPRRMPVRNVKNFKSRLAFIWNFIITSPWIGQAIIELSIAAAVIPYSYLSIILAISYVALTKGVILLY